MKLFLSIFAFVLAFVYCQGQSLIITRDTNEDLVYILNNMGEQYSYAPDTSELLVNVYFVWDPSGSAGFASCEATNSIYIAVSERGEGVDQNLFRISSLYNPKITKWLGNRSVPRFRIEYGPADQRKRADITIGIDRLTISSGY
jgi:hypothetical protein